MAAAIGWLNHAGAAANAHNSVRPMDASTGTTSGTTASSVDSAGISANGFLTLLVTELKNQDPTANTDPNAYINQLVGVNSLQQLIQINSTLSGDQAGSTTASGAAAGTGAVRALGNHPVSSASKAAAVVPDHTVKTVAGNLNVPDTKPDASRVAQALSGQR
jgi:flagellar basal-body rod modification protein FlgD